MRTHTIRGREFAPLNRSAASVTAPTPRGAEPVTPKESAALLAWDAPPVLTERLPKGSPDIKGLRRGQMVAVGYYGPSKEGARWLCRCDCGRYEVRIQKRHKAGAAAGSGDCCHHCRKVRRLSGNPVT